MSYLCGTALAEHYRNNIKAIGSIFNIVGGQKIAGCPGQFCLLGTCDRRFGWTKTFICSGSDLDKDDGTIGIDHDKVNFAGFAGEVAGELFEAFSFQEPFAAFFTPSAEQLSICQQFAPVPQHLFTRDKRPPNEFGAKRDWQSFRGSVLAVALGEPDGLARSLAEVIEFCPSCFAASDWFYVDDAGRM